MASRSKFSLSHYKLLSCDMGELVPCGLMEVLPGDTIQHATSMLLRTQPLLSPVMHPVHARIHHWFVPHRLVWENWEDFITGGPDGLNASVFPTVSGTFTVGSLGDYLGVATGVPTTVSALPFRGYALIWNEWYRDQDLQTKLAMSTAAGVDSTTNLLLQNCDWEKDYFTSARPWEQKGPTITVPLGQSAPVIGLGLLGTTTAGGPQSNVRENAASPRNYPFGIGGGNWATNAFLEVDGTSTTANKPLIRADLTNASAVTVNVLRQALALQRFEEARARYGSRYTEYLRYLGVKSSDARLQRPEYLGGGKQTIQFSEVLQTGTNTADNNGVGTLRGHGLGAMRSNRYRRFFEEHGYVYSFVSVKPRTMYAQGNARTWNRRTKEDFFQKELQFIGQQAIARKEIYAAAASPDATWGYQDRYDDYRRMESTIAGEFRTTVLDFWHMARIFASEPALNASFVSCVPTERVFPVPSNDVLYIMANHNIQARRIVAQTGISKTF